MEFIEKMMAAMRGTATEETATQDTTMANQCDGQLQEGAVPVADEGEVSTLPATQEALEQLLEAKKQEWQEEQAAQEQERLRLLPEEERQRQERLSKDKELADLKAELARRDMQAMVVAELEKQKLPASIAELVRYSDKESTMKSLDKLTGVIQELVLEEVNLRLRGKTPEGLGKAANCENAVQDAFSKAFTQAFQK